MLASAEVESLIDGGIFLRAYGFTVEPQARSCPAALPKLLKTQRFCM